MDVTETLSARRPRPHTMPKPRFYFGALLTLMVFSLFTACACLPLLMIGKGSIGQTHQEACGGAGIPAADRSNEIVDPYKALAKRWYENRHRRRTWSTNVQLALR